MRAKGKAAPLKESTVMQEQRALSLVPTIIVSVSEYTHRGSAFDVAGELGFSEAKKIRF